MNPILAKSLVGLVPTSALFFGAAITFFRGKSVASLLQVIGAGALVIVILAHICEGLEIFPWMHWGLEHSAGHYLDVSAATVALFLFPTGYLVHALRKRAA
ncbi:MAG TPA: hypothetical protein VFR24_04645 [Candidatus Angelobacter sp.]|nr:hypothetical protein [Candidatus Angelobacter sp.]